MRRLRGHRDEGFSMIEVIVAIVILGIVASSALWFFINGMQKSSNLGRQQNAVSIATSAMEQSFVLNPRADVNGVSGLVLGRSSAQVDAAFATVGALGIAGVANTYPLSDPAGVTDGGVLKISNTVTLADKVPYNVYTLVGACYRSSSASGAQKECEKVTGYSIEPSATPVGQARLLRVMVVVTWKPIGAECAGLCTYDVATLVDPSLDLEWNRVIEPVAVDDVKSFATTDVATTLDVLDNDVLGSVPSYPVSIVSGLAAGRGTLGSPSSNGTIPYTPPAAVKGTWVSGIFNFTYRVRDARGQTADAKVSIYLQPASRDDAFDAYLGLSQVLDVNANDLGSPTLITIVTPPSRGSISVSGTTVTYTPTSLGFDQFTYTYADAFDLISPPAIARVTVQAVSAVDTTVEVAYRTDANPSAGWVDVSSQLRGPSGLPAKITVSGMPTPSTGSPAGGQLRIDGVAYAGGTVTGAIVEFQPPLTSFGEWTFPFALNLGTYTSPPAQATMRVWPRAVTDPVGNLKKKATYAVNAGLNDSPATWGTGSGVTVTLTAITPSTCGAWATGSPSAADLTAGRLSITVPNAAKSGCSAKYTLIVGGISSSTTITYSVTN